MVPDPKLAKYRLGVAGENATAVPPVPVVWKSQPEINSAFEYPLSTRRPRKQILKMFEDRYMVMVRVGPGKLRQKIDS
jgi:hypothetical protein